MQSRRGLSFPAKSPGKTLEGRWHLNWAFVSCKILIPGGGEMGRSGLWEQQHSKDGKESQASVVSSSGAYVKRA